MSLIAISLAAASVGFAQHGDMHGHKLGKVEFTNSCSPAVQDKFLRGVAMLHSFYYSAAQRAFEEVVAEDNSCAIATWGYASTLMLNPLQGIGASSKNAQVAQEAIDKGRKMGAKTQRERDYLEAVAAYYENFANRSERERQLTRAKAYEALGAKYPDDDEAQIFNALYLAATQTASDQTYSQYLKAAAILEKQFARHPDHPGVAHYLIHCYDAPPIAQQGLAAARRYADIAPDAPHALHMPSHIFTRVGAWADSVATNRRSATVAEKDNEPDDALHALDYMTYAYLQLARDGDARKTWNEARTLTGINPARATAYYALAAMPARYVVERGAWREAAKLAPSPSNFPFTEAMTHFARALEENWEQRVLGERSRGDATGVGRLDSARAEDEQRRARNHAPGGRHRGQERQEHRHAGAPAAGARAARRPADGAEAPGRGAEGIRGVATARAEPLSRPVRRGAGGGAVRQPR